jgi:hypothetical protein
VVPTRPRIEPAGLRHVIVAGGTPGSWWSMSPEVWAERLSMLAEHVSGAGGSWLTVCPMHTDDEPLAAVAGVPPWPEQPSEIDGVHVIVRCEPDARRRMHAVLTSLAGSTVKASAITESELDAAFALPAPCEPDLAVLFGPDDELPRSLSWELAYAEVVFIPASWTEVDAIVVKAAVAEYFTRNRRFGGVDG